MSTNATNPNASSTANIKFYSINEFKQAVSLPADEKAQVVKNPNTQKLFLTIGSKTFKCQATIDPSQEMKMLVEDDKFDEACLTNVKPSAENVVFSL